MYKIELRKKALKFIHKQDKIMQQRIKKSLLTLAEKPFDFNNKNIQKLTGYDKTYKIRMADIRIKYQIDGSKVLITVLDIDNRGQIYK